MPRDPKFLTRIKAMCARGGLPVGYMGGGSFVGPEEARAERLEKGRADIDMAAFMGAQMLRVFARHKWPDTEEEQEKFWGPMIEDFQECADYAAQKGVVMALQNHNHGSFAMNADQVLRILREVDKPNFTYIMDTGQWEGAIGGSPRGWRDFTVDIGPRYRDHMERVAEHTTLVRAKIYKIDNGWGEGSRGGSPRGWHNTELDIYREYHARVAPYATGVRAKIYRIDNGYEEWLDYPRFFKILRDADYNGTVSIVFEGGVPLRNRFDKEQCIEMGARSLRETIARAYA